MRLKKSYRQLLNEILQPVVAYSASLYLIGLLFVFHIKSLVPGFSENEKIAIAASKSVAKLFEDPLFAPHKVLQYLMAKLAHQGLFAMRGISIIIGLLTIICFYYVVRKWFGFKIAVITTFLLATSSWMLFITRLATTDVMFFSIIAAIAYGTWLQFNPKRIRLNILLGSALTVWLLYIPGMIWFVLLGAIWQRKQIANIFKENRTISLIAITSISALLLPLIYAIFKNHNLLGTYIGINEISIASLKNGLFDLLQLPIRLFVYGPLDPVRNLGRMPLLDFFASIMAILGGYHLFIEDRKLDRFKSVAGITLIAALLISFGNVVGLSILLPIAYILVASGIDMVISNWFRVFPTNPFAKILIVFLLSSSLIFVTFYNLSKYFIAWPQTPITKSTFILKP